MKTAFDANKQNWNDRVAIHLTSEMYDMQRFRAGNSSLKPIETRLLGDVSGLSLLHLQCHFGQDTLSMSRMGAKTVGVDFSEEAVKTATALATELGQDARFVCCNVIHTSDHISEQFDRVFTTYGTITWLPDLKPWASVVADRLKSGGQFIMVDFHPVMWMLDDSYKSLHYPYWSAEGQTYEETGSYADKEADLHTVSHWWNHPISEIITHLTDAGLELEVFEEHDSSPYDCLPGMREEKPGEYILETMGRKIPYLYAFRFRKP